MHNETMYSEDSSQACLFCNDVQWVQLDSVVVGQQTLRIYQLIEAMCWIYAIIGSDNGESPGRHQPII